MKNIQLKIKRLSDIPMPKYQSEHAAGMDLHAAVKETVVLQPGQSGLIPTGISISLPIGFEAQIRPRSGLALKNQISIVNTPGTVDADYRGEIGVILINHGKNSFTVNHGDRIAQMIINKIEKPEIVEVTELDETDRGAGGFGSTGVKKN
jgi:dUTP pyrophosphatase